MGTGGWYGGDECDGCEWRLDEGVVHAPTMKRRFMDREHQGS